MTTRPRQRGMTNLAIFMLLLAASVMLTFGVEWIQRGSLAETWSWTVQNWPLYELNALIHLSILLVVYALIGSLMPSVAFACLLVFLMAGISYFKSELIGEPFFPWDVLLKREGMNIIPLVTNKASLLRLEAAAAVVAVLFLLRLVVPRLRLPLGMRIAAGLLAVGALYLMACQAPPAQKLVERAGVSDIVWNQKQNYADNGLALAFTLNVKDSIVSKPNGYNEPAMAAVAHTISADRASSGYASAASVSTAASPGGKKPNVIFIMNEAFWDPTLLPGVKYSEDPVPTIHRLQKESTSGYLLSPQFGGRTSNVEFEVLTGASMSFLPEGSIPYQQYISKPLPSLASYFEDQGYKSMAIHSYEGWFWNREDVYKSMGFESFMSKSNFAHPEIKGNFISDDEVSRNIIKDVDATDKPMFIYAVTMQNHGPYDDNRYGTNAIQAQGNLTADAKSILETYTHGAHDADQSLQLLIDHFKQTGEPTVIVFYGDHLPMLGANYSVYQQGGLIHTGQESQWSAEELKKMHSVPFVVWSNFDLPQERVPTLSDSFLGAYMLDKLKMEKPAQFAFDLSLSKKVPGLLRNLVVDSDQHLLPSVPEAAKTQVEQYRNLQYDLIFGKRYLAKYIDGPYLSKDALPIYNLEFKVEPTDGKAQGATSPTKPS